MRADYNRHRCVQCLMFTGKPDPAAITGACSVTGSRSLENFKTTEQAWLDMRESGRAVDASEDWSGRLSGRSGETRRALGVTSETAPRATVASPVFQTELVVSSTKPRRDQPPGIVRPALGRWRTNRSQRYHWARGSEQRHTRGNRGAINRGAHKGKASRVHVQKHAHSDWGGNER